VIDPELMLSLPAVVTLQSGWTRLSHALESIWNVNANPTSDPFAVVGGADIFDVLPRLMRTWLTWNCAAAWRWPR
jgi:alcohol dehydrogenase class IV